MTFKLTILGSNSALPAYGRNHTSQVLEVGKCTFMIDCGEGTQMRLSTFKIKSFKIDYIFISHLHGDHYLGLVGLLKSMHLLKRTKELYLFGPNGLQEIITTQLKYSQTHLNYNIVFKQTNSSTTEILFENNNIVVSSFPLDHRIPCNGFLFKEKEKPRKLIKDKLPEDLSLVNIGRLKRGEDALDDEGKVIYKNQELTIAPKKSRSYAYCSDTRYNEALLNHISNVSLLYHEATFLEEAELRASKTYHSTASQAAILAKKANVEQLIIGHFSARYKDITPFKVEAMKYFKNTSLAIEGQSFELLEE